MGAKSPVQEQLESELKRLIVATLKLEDTSPEEIDSEAPLGVAGLGLDSIDVLEVAVAIHKRFGIRTESDEEANRAIFSNVRALADATHAHGGLLVLDCIASGTLWVDMRDLGVDVLLTAPQKGWSASPCAALVMMRRPGAASPGMNDPE